MATFQVSGSIIDQIDLRAMLGLPIVIANATQLELQSSAMFNFIQYPPLTVSFGGSGFTYDAGEQLNGGTISSVLWSASTPNPATGGLDGASVQVLGVNVPVAVANGWFVTGNTAAALNSLFEGNDQGSGSQLGDLIRGFAGDDTLNGLEGYDTIFGGLGNDVIYGRNAANVGGAVSGATTDPHEQNYLRGDEGDDSISGALGFDDINGNMGNDTAHGNAGDDWVVGGKDQDVLFGDAGDDIVWGNLGNDTLDGGDGNDQVRGGQGDDMVNGGTGNDYVSGDRGNDTITGGAGADLFHGSQDAGIDRVLDFHLSEGDKVMLDPGTTFTISQVGADTVIDMGNGNQMILVGVQMSSLPAGTIFLG